MSFEFSFRNNGLVLYTKYRGNISFEEAKGCTYERVKDPDKIKKLKVMVSDLSEASMGEIESDELMMHAKYTSKKTTDLNDDLDLIAIVSDDLNYGLSRLWQNLASTLPLRVHIVETVPEAEKLIEEILNNKQVD